MNRMEESMERSRPPGEGGAQRVPSISGLRPLTSTALQDLLGGLSKVELWGRLGWLDVKRRYRRTVIGPFWTSITLAVYVICVGAVGAGLSHQDLGVYLPFLVSGMIVWMLLSGLINEGCVVLIIGHPLFRNVRFEFSILLYALLWKSLLIFVHNFLVYLLVVLIWKREVFGFASLLALPGLALLLMNGAWIALACGMFCLRFRDVQQLVGTIVQISMLITPLFWPAESLSGPYRWAFVELNPIYHLLDIVRAPLLGQLPSLSSYVAVLAITVCGWVFAYLLFRRFRSRISYWS